MEAARLEANDLQASGAPVSEALAPGQLPYGSTNAWTAIGPAPIAAAPCCGYAAATTTGRVSAIAVHPNNADIAYAGAATGGVFRTLDGGHTWTPLLDGAASLAVGALALSPADPTTLWVGTGEGASAFDCYSGVGLYRILHADTVPVLEGPFETRVAGTSTTAGNGHAFLGRGITAIAIDPASPARLYVATTTAVTGFLGAGGNPPGTAETGLYLSQDATAAAPTFSRVNLSVTSALVSDVIFEPGSSAKLLLGVRDTSNVASGVYRSTDADSAAPSFARTLALGSPLRVKLAANRVAGVVTTLAATEEASGTLLRSDDGGATWPTVLTAAAGFCGSQCWYDMTVTIDPGDAAIIYLGGQTTPLRRSTDAGVTFSSISSSAGSPSFALHPDTHAVVVAPSNTAVIYTGNDGGIYRSLNAGNPAVGPTAVTWQSLNRGGFSATQYVSVATHPLDRTFTIGGTQDNGTLFWAADASWPRVAGGDGGYSVVDQTDADTTTLSTYHTYYNSTGSLIGYERADSAARNASGAFTWTGYGCGFANANGMTCSDTVLFYAPMEQGPGSPNTLYFGTDRLYRSADKGVSMALVSQAPLAVYSGTSNPVPVSAIGISPQLDLVRLVGLRTGEVFYTTSGSSTLIQVSPRPWQAKYVSRVVPDPADRDTAYVVLNGYMGGTSAALSHVWRTTNLRNVLPTWTAVNGTGVDVLPDVPVNGFAVDPWNRRNLFAGTDIGVFASADGGATWGPFGIGLPRVPVLDMAIANAGLPSATLRIATHGRGLWETAIGTTASGWTRGSMSPTARSEHAAVTVGGKVYLIGGRNAAYVTAVEEYDPATGTWTAKASLPSPRAGLAAVAVGGKIYAMGGQAGSTFPTSVWEFDPAVGATGQWTQKSAMPTGRAYLGAVAVGGTIYAIGGFNAGALDTVEIYSPFLDQWSQPGSAKPMPTARYGLAAAEAGGKIYALGGYQGSVLDAVEEYDPATGSWTPRARLPAGRGYAAAVGVNRKVHVYGGSSLALAGRVDLPNVDVFDPQVGSDGSWTPETDMPTGRTYPAAALAAGKVFVTGGYSPMGGYLRRLEERALPLRTPHSDLNGDGKSDLLWRSTSTGAVYAYLANGTTGASFQPAYVTTQTSDWQIVGKGDFNGDGKTDLLWRSTSLGSVYVYLSTSSGSTASFQPGYLTTQTADWQIVGIGDFDGDGKSDILWRSTADGRVYAYLATGITGTVFQPAYVTTQTPDWQIVGLGDFNGDGKTDLLWRSTSSGAVYVYVATGTPGTVSFQPGYLTTQTADWQVVGVGDLDGDGKSDLLWRSTSGGQVYAYLATGTSGTTFQPAYVTTQAADWQMVGFGDFNGDGKTDILWRSTSLGSVYVYVATGSPGAVSFQPGYVTTQTADWQIVR